MFCLNTYLFAFKHHRPILFMLKVLTYIKIKKTMAKNNFKKTQKRNLLLL